MRLIPAREHLPPIDRAATGGGARLRGRIWLSACAVSLAALALGCAPRGQGDLGPVAPPVRLWSPALAYPPAMLAAGIEGKVVLEGVVDSTGHVDPSSIRVLRSSDPAFDDAAITMLRGTRFKPAERDQQAISALVKIPIDFALASVEIDSATANEALARAERLIRRGEYQEAVTEFNAAQTSDPRLSSSRSFWYPLCWHGTLWNHAADVLAGCDDLVALAPEDVSARRARGMARAVTGDFAGAIADFEVALRGPVDAGIARVLQEWIGELRADRNPVTARVLESLRAREGPGGGLS
jgi:TonB family protein